MPLHIHSFLVIARRPCVLACDGATLPQSQQGHLTKTPIHPGQTNGGGRASLERDQPVDLSTVLPPFKGRALRVVLQRRLLVGQLTRQRTCASMPEWLRKGDLRSSAGSCAWVRNLQLALLMVVNTPVSQRRACSGTSAASWQGVRMAYVADSSCESCFSIPRPPAPVCAWTASICLSLACNQRLWAVAQASWTFLDPARLETETLRCLWRMPNWCLFSLVGRAHAQ